MLINILKFFFGFGNKCERFDRRYTRKGYVSRIIMMLTYLVFSGGMVAFIYFGLPFSFEKNVILGILAVLLAIGLIFTVVSEDIILAVVAFKCFVVRNIKAISDNIKHKKENKKLEQLKEENGGEIIEEAPKTSNEINEDILREQENKKSYRWFDFFAIFIFAGFAVATVALSIVIAKSLVG